jgi:hypothetical protein
MTRHTLLPAFIVACALLLWGHGPLQAQVEWSEERIEEVEDVIRDDPDRIWLVRLLNGDILTGPLLAVERDDRGVAVRLGAAIGRAKIYLAEMVSIETQDNAYRHRHRTFIMPTAEPIDDDHFLGLWEIAFLYGGVGIADVVSVTAGRTFVPGISAAEQASHVNVKATVYSAPNGIVESGKQFYAVGTTATWLGANNVLGHAYVVATFTGPRTQVSTMFFSKIYGEDFYTITGGTLFNPFNLTYPTGTMGVGLSLDSRLPTFHDVRIVGELWNNDLTRPSNTALYLGVRTATGAVAMDFGLTLFSAPAVVPFVAFAWTPL